MGMVEGGGKLCDLVEAQLIECAPDPETLSVDVSAVPEATSPVQQAQDATIETTGADPPPEGDR